MNKRKKKHFELINLANKQLIFVFIFIVILSKIMNIHERLRFLFIYRSKELNP